MVIMPERNPKTRLKAELRTDNRFLYKKGWR